MGASLHFMAPVWDDPPSRAPADDPAPDDVASSATPVSAEHPDWALVEAIRAGDRAAFEGLYRRVYDALWTFAMRVLRSPDVAEDVVHDVFLAVWCRRDVWSLRGSVEAYLFTAVRNRALKVVRHETIVARTHESGIVGEMLQQEEMVSTNDAEERPDTSRQRRLQAALAKLPERHATALYLRWHQDMTYPEIAQVLGISPQAARTLVLRVQAALQREVG